MLWLEKLKKDELCRDEEGWGGRRNRGGEGRWSGHILIITDEITDIIIFSINLSAILSV
jgi:hypothetical protein